MEILRSESQTTINLALVFKSEIRRLLEECNDDGPVIVTRLKKNMLQRLDHRFPVTNTIVAATLLDCRFQSIKEIDIYMENQDTNKVAFLTKFLKNILNEANVVDPTRDTTPGPSSTPTTSNFLMNLGENHSCTSSDIDSVVENEDWKHFSTVSVKVLQPYDGDVLMFWKDRKISFPWLSTLA